MDARTPPRSPSTPPNPPNPAAWWAWSAWGYLLGLVGVWALLAAVGERWWLGTVFLFSPRWVLGVPFVVFIPAALHAPKRLGVPLLLALLVFLGPTLGGTQPWSVASEGPGFRLRLLTCNVAGDRLDAAALRRLLDDVGPDVVTLQEWRPGHESALFGDSGWHVCSGRGLCLASRLSVRADEALADEHGWRDLICRYDLETPGGRVQLCNLHLPTPRGGLEAVFSRGLAGVPELEANTAERRRESGRAVRFAAQSNAPLLLAGDFNMPADSTVYCDDWGRFTNAFSSAGLGWGHTKHTRWHGVRIDHVLAGPGWQFRRCWVGPDVGSDHRPVLADVRWVGVAE